MKHTDISQLFGVPFGAQADSTTIAAIPTSKTAIGRASMALGFPKENFQPLDNGGQPVSGADLNGILNTLARSAQAAELGVLHPFSASYAEAIGGYPSGATIAHPTIAGRFLICTSDGNSNDPSQNMAGWADPLAAFPTSAALANYATAAELTTETQRAEQAEAGLLPLGGGQLTGNLSGSLGGAIPQVLGLSGRVVMQAFVARGSPTPNAWVSFQTAFSPGTTPLVWLQIDMEENGGGDNRTSSLSQNSNNNGPNITNTGFQFQPAAIWPGGIAFSGYNWTVQVLAIGVI